MKRICSSPSNILWEQIVNPAPPPDREAAIYRALVDYRLELRTVHVGIHGPFVISLPFNRLREYLRMAFVKPFVTCKKPVKIMQKAEPPEGRQTPHNNSLLHNEVKQR